MGSVVVNEDFFASFCAFQRLGASEGLLSSYKGREGFLRPITPFESSEKVLLGSREDWRPPGVRGFVSELRVWGGVVERILKGLGRREDFLSLESGRIVQIVGD